MRTFAASHRPAPRPQPGGGTGPAHLAGLLWLLLLPSLALGHGIELSAGRGAAAWARGEYSGGEPMSFAKARVLGPDGQTHQVGNTDAQGRFAWLPDRDGPWRVALDDGQGHRGEADLDWRTASGDSPGPTAGRDLPTGQSFWSRAIWGLSFIFWLSGLAFWRLGCGRRRR